MRIICPTCACHYEVEAEKVGPTGQLVRCAECRDVWLVRRDDELARPQSLPARSGRAVDAFAAAAVAASRPADAATSSAEGPIDFQSARARLRRRGSAEGTSRLRGSSAGTLLSVAAAVAAVFGVAIGSRASIVTQLPQAAPAFAAVGLPVQTAGLALQDVRSVVSRDGDRTVLDLQGRIANLQDSPASVPDLSVVVRDNSATPLYSWKASAPTPSLKGGETVAFRTRLSAPPAGSRDVRVSFADISPLTH